MLKEKMLVPQLRFPEFEGEWKINKLGQIAKFLKGKGISKRDIINDGDNECIRYGELYTTYNEVIDSIASKTNVALDVSVLSNENDVIIPSSGETQLDIVTASCVLKKGVILGGDLNIIRTNLNGVFLSYLLNNRKKKDIAKLSQGNSVVHLYNKQLATLNLNLPTPKEQQKIANFLTSIDNRIQTLEKKKTLLEQYKKGVMQKIFKQELRFKDDTSTSLSKSDGKEFPEWEEKKLGDFLIERNIKKPKNKDYPLMSFVAHKGVTPKGERYNREFLVNNTNSKKYKQTEFSDFIYSSNNLETGSIGLNLYGSACISPVYSIFQIRKSSEYRFMNSYLKRKSFINKMLRFRQGVVYGQWKIHESDFLKIKEKFPSLMEQTKIANFLIAIDKNIALVTKKVEHTKTYKKGLLQQMFV
jgi:type I restriction enzyme S subunit